MTDATGDAPEDDKVPTDLPPSRPRLPRRYNPKALWPLLGVIVTLYIGIFAFWALLSDPWSWRTALNSASAAVAATEPAAVALWLIVVASRVIVRKTLKRRADGVALGLTLVCAAVLGFVLGVYPALDGVIYRTLSDGLIAGCMLAVVLPLAFAIPAAIAHFVVPDALQMPPDPPEAAADDVDIEA